jgi:hypothetical protein
VWEQENGDMRLSGIVLAIVYSVTAFIGIPAVADDYSERVLAEHKALKAEFPQLVPQRIWETPRLSTTMMIPLVPGVVFSMRSHTFGPLSGLGTLNLSLWYVVGVRTLVSVPLWRA